MEKIIQIDTEYIPLVQLLKMTDIISSGGAFKYFILENDIYYNQEIETRKKKKVYAGDIVKVDDLIIKVQSAN